MFLLIKEQEDKQEEELKPPPFQEEPDSNVPEPDTPHHMQEIQEVPEPESEVKTDTNGPNCGIICWNVFTIIIIQASSAFKYF